MNHTVRQKILNNLTTELLYINSANGYNNSIAEVRKGYFSKATVNNYPTAFVQFGSDDLQEQIEGYTYGQSDLDVLVLVYINSPEATQVDDSELMIEDLYRFFNRDDSIPQAFTSSLESLDYVQNYKTVQVAPYIAGNKNYTAVAVVLKINYFNFIEPITPFPALDAPDLVLPLNNATDAEIYQNFNWDSVSEATNYTIQIATDDQFGNVVVEQSKLPTSSFTIPDDSGLTNLNEYYWRVKAFNTHVESEWSDTWSFIVNEDLTPAIPTLVAPLASTETISPVDFVWTTSARATSWDFQLANDSGFTSLLVDTTLTRTTYEYTPIANVLRYWRVRSRNTDGTSAWVSSTVTFNVVLAQTPSEIGSCILWTRSDLGVTTVTGNKVSAWTDQSGQSNNLTQGTDANRPVLTANVYGTKSGIYHDAVGSIRKVLGYNDTTGKFQITSGNSKSFMITILSDQTYLEGNNQNGIIALSNASFGHNWILGKYNDNLGNIRGVMQFPRYNTSQTVAVPLTNNLTQIIIIYDGTVCYSYKDGVLLNKFTRTITNPISNNTQTYLTIGAEYFTANNSQDFKGYTFEVAYWNKALTAAEIASLYKYHTAFYG